MTRCLAGVLLVSTLVAQSGYRAPPDIVRRCIEAPPPPSVSLSPGRDFLLLSSRQAMPSIAVMARPILRLAGRRIDPRTFGPRRGARGTGFALQRIADGTVREVALPADADLGSPIWTADGKGFAFANTRDDSIELWVCDVESARARRVPGVRLNATMGTPAQWMPDQKTLLVTLVADLPRPERPSVPAGPVTQQTSGGKAPVRTFQDLLQNRHDEALFAYYTTSRLAFVDAKTGDTSVIGDPRIVAGVSPSPDGRFLLLTEIVRPFSYLVTARSFPRRISVVDRAGRRVREIADVPLADKVPIGGVRTGRRRVRWMPTVDATLTWLEALDGGDPRRKAEHRDKLMVLAAPFRSEPREWARTPDRVGGRRRGGISYGERGDFAFIQTHDRRKRRLRLYRANPRKLDERLALIHERSSQDAYGDPGRPLMKRSRRGHDVILQYGDQIYLRGSGASPQGDRPFLDRWNLASGAKERLFRSAEGSYEQVTRLLADDASRILVRSESRTETPNYLLVADGKRTALTSFQDPRAAFTSRIRKQLLHYERADGVKLSGTLYLPLDHEEGRRLPLLVWAYPREYTSKGDAGQVRGSPHRYVRLSGTSPLLLTLVGYAVLYNAALPVVGPTRTANDTFVEQLVLGAKAAIDEVVGMGVADPERCAISGHSYGAFMTANLLAHSDLFRAGVARSGAYNRTLTPFGFQNERRTFWEAPHVYFAMSPFMHAHKINEPLLMIHGMADNNSGTFPMQSKRLFHAVKGNGGVARLVMLPHESHGYRARESILHCMAETIDWLDTHVKNAGSMPAKSPGSPQK